MAIGREVSRPLRLPRLGFFLTYVSCLMSVEASASSSRKKKRETTFDGGSLGSRIDEERSQLR